MHNFDKILPTLKKVTTIFLVVALIAGVLSSGFGAVVFARNIMPAAEEAVTPEGENAENGATDEGAAEQVETEYPTDKYSDFSNEITLNDDVIILSESESQSLTSSITSIESYNYYGEAQHTIEFAGEDLPQFENVYDDDIIYIDGDDNSPLGGGRFFRVEDIYSYSEKTILYATEPYFEDVFSGMETAVSDLLTEENFVEASYMDGVTSHFGDASAEITSVSQSGSLGDVQVQTLSTSSETPQVTNTANKASTANGDIIVELNVDLGKNEEENDDDDDNSYFNADASCQLTGKIGIENLAAHLVSDMPSFGQFEELYVGVSGDFIADVRLEGKLEATAKTTATSKDTKFLSLEGLNNKLLPIAVFKFKGTTPVYITNKQFKNQQKTFYPTMYFMVYSDWEGNISVSLSAGFNFKHSFNNGLRIVEKGNPGLKFEKYPYTQAYDVDSENGLTWDATLDVDAYSDITLLGSSVVIYIAGINICEISVARIGIEAEASTQITANSKEGVKACDSDDSYYYLRGYLKLIEMKVKLKAEGKSFLDNVSIDAKFDFSLLEKELFRVGETNNTSNKVPISSKEAPTDYSSVISVVFDVSGSMYDSIDTGETKLDAAKTASKIIVDTTEKWAEKYNKENFGLGVVQFASSSTTVCVPNVDYKFIKDCIDIMEDGGGTCIHYGLETAILQLDAVNSKNKIIILMTDGVGEDDYATLEQARNAASKGIKIYTVGFGYDVEEDHLKEIAEIGGGEYRFADTQNLMGIVGSFMYTQQASTSKVITEIEGTVSEGETTPAKDFIVNDANGNLHVTTAWPGSFLDTILIDPTGRVVDENYPGAVTDESSIPSTITVTNPISGKWKLKIKGVETSYENEPYYTIVSFKATEGEKANATMTQMEEIASYCLPIGFYVTVVSTMLLICIGKKKSKKD